MTRPFRTSLRLLRPLTLIAFVSSCVESGSPDASHSTGGASSQVSPSAGTGGSSGPDASLTGDAVTLAKAMGMGVNIGNTLENTAVWETGWGQPLITQTYINGMATHGIKTVRVPVAWDTFSVNGVVPAEKMARVHQVVRWIVDAGMYAIVNIHWDRGWINNQNKVDSQGNSLHYILTDDVRAKFASYWTQISTAFADVGDHLVLEALNEEGVFRVGGTGASDYAPLNELNQTFVNVVRESGGANETRALLISGFATDIAKTCVDAFAIPSDPAGAGKLFLSIHYYNPSTFTMLGAPASYGDPATTWGTPAEQATLQSLFNRLTTFSLARNIPIVIGEFAVTFGSGQYVRESASRILWMTSVSSAAFAGTMVPVLWDTGGDVNRSNGSLSSDFQAVMDQLGQ